MRQNLLTSHDRHIDFEITYNHLNQKQIRSIK